MLEEGRNRDYLMGVEFLFYKMENSRDLLYNIMNVLIPLNSTLKSD